MAETDPSAWFAEETATFGDRLAGAREAAGLTQEAVARNLGVRIRTYRAWEDDLSEPRGNRLQMLAGMLNVSIRWLLTGEGDGLQAPSSKGALSDAARAALADLARIRSQVVSLTQEMGRMERRLAALLREDVE